MRIKIYYPYYIGEEAQMAWGDKDLFFAFIVAMVCYMWYNFRNVKNSGTVAVKSNVDKKTGARQSAKQSAQPGANDSMRNTGSYMMRNEPMLINGASVSPSTTGGRINLSELGDLAGYTPESDRQRAPGGGWDAAEMLPGGVEDIDSFELAAPVEQAGTMGPAMRNSNHQLRNDPPIEKFNVGPWSQTTIDRDPWRKPIDA